MEKLKRYDLNCNIFDVYEYDGLSMQELLCQFYTKINECVDFSNSTMNLCGWLVNEGLKEEVALKLSNWLTDGTLENVINVSLFENLDKKIDNVDTQLSQIAKVISNDVELYEIFDNCNDGDYLLINENITIDEITLLNKNNITIEFKGKVSQIPSVNDDFSLEHSKSNQPTFNFINCENLKIINPLISPIHEGIFIQNCSGEIVGGLIDGLGKSKFSGVNVYTNKKFTIQNLTTVNCGTQPKHDGNSTIIEYGGGHGIHLSVSSNITVKNCESYGNGANGIFLYACDNIALINNYSHHNGMSGIQLGFGRVNDNSYIIDGNICSFNIADGLDINNATLLGNISIKATIINNIFKNNGWYGDKSTQDGSGICTLINVSDVIISNNISEDSNRTGLYLNNCKNVSVVSNKIKKSSNSKGEGIYISNCLNINVVGNDVDTDNLISIDFRGELDNINVKNNNFNSTGLAISIPNETNYNNIIFTENNIKTGESINVKFNLLYNNIEFVSMSEGLKVSDIDNLMIIGNKIKSHIYGINLTNSKNSIIKHNKIDTNDISCIVLGNSKNNIIEGNIITSNSQSAITLRGMEVSNNYLIKNILSGGSSSNSYRLEPSNCGTTYLDSNIILSGFDENGTGLVYRAKWS